ncbi:MAG: prepilin-type N-terminal cleavage/methylation domain-containing protein [Verrucomicrobiae bacterium]|nr:prepilin-type N-terminal cleavage/methylation domain-containing protein [Verrucomicrobiae bacterium]
MKRNLRDAFTLIELLIVVLIIALIASMLLPAINQAKQQAKLARCTTNLRQLGLAVRMYLDDSGGWFFKYQNPVSGGCYWYFGYETSASLSAPEGQRQIDVTKAKLYPYFRTIGGIELCPSFPYELSAYKAKYKGASYGYGMNLRMDSAQESSWDNRGGQLIWFADCAQVNTFQPPASPANPLFEEFYYVDPVSKLVHFRHNGRANALFCDGHVEALSLYPGTLDTRLPAANIGRFNATGDSSMFQ